MRQPNKSGLRPLGHAVLIEPYEPEMAKAFATSKIVIPETVSKRTQMLETRGTVIEAGPAAWEDEKVPRAAPGDKVMMTAFAGVVVVGTADGRQYRMINDRDIFCAIEVESNG